MKEKNFQTMFSKWIKGKNLPTTAWELKIVKLKSMPFDAVKEHQVKALLDARFCGLYHKINDAPWGGKMRFTTPKPFDCFNIAEAEAYVVIWFYHPRQKKEMIWIDINDFVDEKDTSKRKSLTEERAKEIGMTYDL